MRKVVIADTQKNYEIEKKHVLICQNKSMVNALNLFSGCGGCSLGLQQAGFSVKLATEIDTNTCQTYSQNLGSDGIWSVDLSQVTPEEILERSRLNPSQLNLIVGGPPCQGFSSAGAKDWQDPRNSLLKKFVEIVIHLKPTWFILENVEGLLTSKEGFFIVEAIARFLETGYWVRARKIYMERYGLPQKRKRVLIVGNLEECSFEFPNPTFSNDSGQLSLFPQQRQLSILDAISDLPNPTEKGIVFYDKSARCDYQTQLRRSGNLPILHHQIKIDEVQIFIPPGPPMMRGEQEVKVPPHHRGDLGGIKMRTSYN